MKISAGGKHSSTSTYCGGRIQPSRVSPLSRYNNSRPKENLLDLKSAFHSPSLEAVIFLALDIQHALLNPHFLDHEGFDLHLEQFLDSRAEVQ